jgi:hypothetical protein
MLPANRNNILIIGVVVTVFTAILIWWFLKDDPIDVAERVPGMDNRPKMEARSDSVIIGQFFDTLGSGEQILTI